MLAREECRAISAARPPAGGEFATNNTLKLQHGFLPQNFGALYSLTLKIAPGAIHTLVVELQEILAFRESGER